MWTALDYRNGTLDPRNDFHFVYSAGIRCNTANPGNCHRLSLDATNFQWLVIDGANNSRCRFQGQATLTVDGATTTIRSPWRGSTETSLPQQPMTTS